MRKPIQKEPIVAIWAEAQKHLEEAIPEISTLMEQKFARVNGKPEPGSDLDQCGLSDGVEIVRSYIANNELGVALEHLCYMVEETNLPISARTHASLKAAEQIMGMDIRALRSIKPIAT